MAGSSDLRNLLVVSMMISDGEDADEIVRLAASAVPALGCRAHAGYLLRNGRLECCPIDGKAPGRALETQVEALAGRDGPVTLPEHPWGWAYALRSVGGHFGYLVVASEGEPPADGRLLLGALARQAGAALTGAALSRERRERARELRALVEPGPSGDGLGRELVDELVAGIDGGVTSPAQTSGHDLHLPHRVVAIQGEDRPGAEAVVHAVGRAARSLGLATSFSSRSEIVVLLARCPPGGGGQDQWTRLHGAVSRQLGSAAVAVGVGGRCQRLAELPRSCREALRALAIRKRLRDPDGVTIHDELGIYGILAAGNGNQEIERYVRQWLGALLDYDASHHTELLSTLSVYLECGGNYDRAAKALLIHRSTLRYRLRRIRQVSGLDLREVDSRLNLHVATRAWTVLGGGRRRPGTAPMTQPESLPPELADQPDH